MNTTKAVTGEGDAPRNLNTIEDWHDYWRNRSLELEAQRDELLAALKAITRTTDPYEILPLSEHPTFQERDSHNAYKQDLFVKALNKARAAIAKAEQH